MYCITHCLDPYKQVTDTLKVKVGSTPETLVRQHQRIQYILLDMDYVGNTVTTVFGWVGVQISLTS